MCGIFGLLTANPEHRQKTFADKMNDAIKHRGPNDQGLNEFENGFAGMVRLSIVDRAGGHQPIYSADKRFGIVYNGEVYNYQELRKDLEAKGHRFSTHSDTEVVLNLFIEYGTESFKKLNGMFAFLVWDQQTGKKFLVRDQQGIKPLYSYQDSTTFAFSSELKGLLCLPFIKFELDPLGLQDYLAFRYVTSPNTFFKNVSTLPCGYYLEITGQHSVLWNYQAPPIYNEDSKLSEKENLEKLSDLLSGAVASQLMGEVPVGVLLSGGVDSTAIAYHVSKQGARLKTFNIGFPEVNEFEYSRIVAKKLELEHIEIETTVDELIALYPKVSEALDQPIADPACLPLYRLAEELKKHVTVVLSGEGGDELFGGYPQYKDMLQHGHVNPHLQYQNFMQRGSYNLETKKYFVDPSLPPSHMRFRKYFEENTLLNGMLCHDMQTWMPDNLMMKADKILMAHSLEGRFPFLDQNLYQFSTTLSEDLKINSRGVTKYLLKQHLLDKIPDNVIHRPKMGFTVPVVRMLQMMKDQVFESFTSAEKGELSEILDFSVVNLHLANFYTGKKEQEALRVWTLFTFFYWWTQTLPRLKAH